MKKTNSGGEFLMLVCRYAALGAAGLAAGSGSVRALGVAVGMFIFSQMAREDMVEGDDSSGAGEEEE